MGRIIVLNCISADNNNKIYKQEENADGTTWTASWGRIGCSLSTQVYPMSDWDKKYKEKCKKGYTDVTSLMSVATADLDDAAVQFSSIPAIQELVDYLQACAKNTVKNNYTVAVADVTEKQLQTAQDIINELAKKAPGSSTTWFCKEINDTLLKLYSTIPRKMSDTRKFLLQCDADGNQERFQKILSNEQDLLDVLKTQVSNSAPSKVTKDLASYGISIELASDDDRKRIAKTTDFKIGNQKVFKVTNHNTEKAFNAIQDKTNIQLLFHGSRSQNWWSIINQGLKIRPSNAIKTGSMLGTGIYAANKAKKSIGYTDLKGSYWASGSSNKAYLALYEFNLGKSWDLIGPGKKYEGWMGSLDYKKVKDKGYDSVYARGGADLINDELVIYEENRCTIRYLIELTV